MMNMVYGNPEKEQYFIKNIEQKDDKLHVTYANDQVEIVAATNHNIGFYRHRMIEQAKQYLSEFSNELSKESFFAYVKKYGSIIGGIVGLFLLYNVDIHIVMKIILTILIVLGEIAYYFFNEILLSVMSEDCRETLATEYYLANLQDFCYYDPEKGADGYILPPEDISKYHLDDRMLQQMSETIKDFKSQGFEDKEIFLTYKKADSKTKPKK